MARPLVRGAVKTRLAQALGDDGALAVYERLLRGTLDSAERVPGAALVLAEAPDGDAEPRRQARPTPRRPTRSPDARPLVAPAAARRRPRRTARRRVRRPLRAGAGVGRDRDSDSPALPLEYLEQAFARARRPAALVLGPAADGGYYLIGAGRETWDAGAAALTRAARRRRR